MALQEDIIETIERIDKDTVWEEREPEWWLDMMNLDRLIRGNLSKPQY